MKNNLNKTLASFLLFFVIFISEAQPILRITNPPEVCSPNTVDLTDSIITKGTSTAGLSGANLTYWMDTLASIPVNNPSAISVSGTYFIKLGFTLSVHDIIQPVKVKIFNSPNIISPGNQIVCDPYLLPVITGANLSGNQNYYNNSQASSGKSISGYLTNNQTVWIYDSNGSCSDEKSFQVTINSCGTIEKLYSSDIDTHKVCTSNTMSEIKYLTTATSGVTITGLPPGVIGVWNSDTLKINGIPTTSGNYRYEIKLTDGNGMLAAEGYINVYDCNSATLLITPLVNSACSPATVDITKPSITASSPKGIVLSYWKDANATMPLDSASMISRSGVYYIKSTNGSDTDIKGVYVFLTSVNLSITNPSPLCYPSSVDITLPAITAGSSPGGTFSYWNDPACTSILSNPTKINSSGIYYIKLSLGNCFEVKPVVVTINNPVLVINNPADVCANDTVDITLPSITLGSTVGGVLSYWTNSACTSILSSPTKITSSGTYYVKLSIGNCFDVKPVVVNISDPILVINNPASVCYPDSVDITVSSITKGSSSGGVLTYWNNSQATSSLSIPNDIKTTGTYYIKSTLGNCSITKPVDVTIDTCKQNSFELNSAIGTDNQTICKNTTIVNIGYVTFPMTGATFKGLPPGVTGIWNTNKQVIISGSPTAAGTFKYTIHAVGAHSSLIDSISGLITVQDCIPDTLIITNPSPVCSPQTVDITSSFITQGSSPNSNLTYWTDAAATQALTSPSTISVSGTYYIKLEKNSFTDIKPVIVEVNSCNTITLISPWTTHNGGKSTCVNTSMSPIIYVTTVATGAELVPHISTESLPKGIQGIWNQDTMIVSGILTEVGQFRYKVNTIGGVGLASESGAISVVNCTSATLNILDPDPVCFPSTVDITKSYITAGSSSGITSLTYWKDSLATIPETNPSAISVTGTYYIKAIGGSDTDIKPVHVTVNSSVNFSIKDPSPVCAPITIDITSSATNLNGGTLSYWNDSICTSPITNPSLIFSSGKYYIKSSINNCYAVKPVNVVINASPNLQILNPTPVCYPSTVDITNNQSINIGLLSYWKDAACFKSLNTPDLIADSGTYFIKSTLGTCSEVKSIKVSINVSPSLVITNPPSACYPSTVDIKSSLITAGSKGGGTLTYWKDSSCTAMHPNPDRISISGTYYIKSTVGNCFDIKPVIVFISNNSNLVITDPASVCSPATIDITSPSITTGSYGLGTLSYWTDSTCSINLANPTTVSTSGKYYIKSGSGVCSIVKPVTVTINETPIVTITYSSKVCQPAKANLLSMNIVYNTTNSNVVLSYWMDSNCTLSLTNPAEVSTSGTYYVKSTLGSCSSVVPVPVLVNPSPIISITEQKVSAQGQCDGVIQVTVLDSNGIDYSFNWAYNSDTNSLIQTGLCAGIYKFSIKSNNGCSKDTIAKVGITAPSNPCVNSTLMVSTSTIQLTGPSTDDGKIISTVSGGIAPYAYNWSNGSTSSLIESLSSDTYRLIVTDAEGCSVVTTGIISKYVAPNVSVPLKAYIISSGETASSSCDGSASVIASGGAQPYTYLHSNGTTSSSISYLCQGLYNVKVIDVNQDTVVVNYIITSPSNTIVNKSIAGSIQPVDSCYADLIKNCTIDIDNIDSAYIVGFTMIGKDSVSVQWKVVDVNGVSNVLNNNYLLPDSIGVFQFSLQLYCPTKSIGQLLTAYDQFYITQNVGSLGLSKGQLNKIVIYPNPFRDHIIIALENSESTDVLITDIAGKEVFNRMFNDKLIEIDMNSFSTGSYIITVRNNNKVTTKQIVK